MAESEALIGPAGGPRPAHLWGLLVNAPERIPLAASGKSTLPREGRQRTPSLRLSGTTIAAHGRARVQSNVADRTFRCGRIRTRPRQDQHRQSGRDGEQRKHRRAGFGLAGFGRGFDDLIMSSRCHGTLDSRMLLNAFLRPRISEGKRMMPCHVPGFALATSTCGAWQGQGQAALASCRALVPAHSVPGAYG